MDESNPQTPIGRAAARLADALVEGGRQLILAESCTAGQTAASLGLRPGISKVFVGSFVTYHIDLKHQILGVERALLDDPGPVSAVVAEAMAVGALEQAPMANLAGSVTGHLGPDAPPELDGVVYFGFAERTGNGPSACVTEFRCRQANRADRAAEVTERMLVLLAEVASGERPTRPVDCAS